MRQLKLYWWALPALSLFKVSAVDQILSPLSLSSWRCLFSRSFPSPLPAPPPPHPHIEGAFYWYCLRANPPSTYTDVLFKMSVTEWTPSSFFGPCLGVCCWSNPRLWEVSVTGRHPSSGWFKQNCIRDKLKIVWIIVFSSSSFQSLWAMSSYSWKQKQTKKRTNVRRTNKFNWLTLKIDET